MAAAPSDLSVSVLICAYTEARWEALTAAVASVLHQTRPALELIVVCDHNSALLARVAQLPGVVAAENTGERGLSGARNSGLRLARGEVVAFLDDDAEAQPNWLEQLIAGYTRAEVAGVGGAITPRWPERRPRWFPEEFDWVVGCTYRGMPTAAAPVRNLIGCNMSLRRAVFAKAGGFRQDMGRVGRLPVGCEETELCIRVGQALPGSQMLYQPAARVAHQVTAERTTWRYFLSRCFHEGRSKAAVAALAGSRVGLATERAYALRTLPRGVLRGLADTLTGRDLAGALRAAAIGLGLAFTGLGYVTGRVSQVLGRQRWAPTAGNNPVG